MLDPTKINNGKIIVKWDFAIITNGLYNMDLKTVKEHLDIRKLDYTIQPFGTVCKMLSYSQTILAEVLTDEQIDKIEFNLKEEINSTIENMYTEKVIDLIKLYYIIDYVLILIVSKKLRLYYKRSGQYLNTLIPDQIPLDDIRKEVKERIFNNIEPEVAKIKNLMNTPEDMEIIHKVFGKFRVYCNELLENSHNIPDKISYSRYSMGFVPDYTEKEQSLADKLLKLVESVQRASQLYNKIGRIGTVLIKLI
jgi:hypothetical protein